MPSRSPEFKSVKREPKSDAEGSASDEDVKRHRSKDRRHRDASKEKGRGSRKARPLRADRVKRERPSASPPRIERPPPERRPSPSRWERSRERGEQGERSGHRGGDRRPDRFRPNEADRREREKNNAKRVENYGKRRKAEEEGSQEFAWGKPGQEDKKEDEAPVEKEKPNFGTSGKLAEDTNKFNGIVITYTEPPEAKKPKLRWRLYPFKEDESLPVLYVHRQSAYLIGRDRRVADIPVDHPSCSKQHAALQYRLVPYEREDGSKGRQVKPYIIDLNSANGTFLNNQKIEPQRYHELIERDVLKFGFSTREYVVLNEYSAGAEADEEEDNPPTSNPP